MNKIEVESKIIDFLRFPLILGVISIHVSFRVTDGLDVLLFKHILFFTVKIVASVGVPLFFFFSGLLYFKNIQIFDKSIYLTKTKKRIRSLVVPYLFWNIIYLPIYIFIYKTPIDNYFSFFWNINNGYAPVNFPLWFLRDLIILCLLSPIIWFSLKKLKGVVLIIFLACWYLGWIQMPGLCAIGLLFFSAGAYLSIHRINLVYVLEKIPFLGIFIPYFLCVCIDMYFLDYSLLLLGKTSTLLGAIFFLKITLIGIKSGRLHSLAILSKASFFVYLSHELILRYVGKIYNILFPPYNNFTYILFLFASILITVSLALFAYSILKKIAPAFLVFISGNRT